MSSNLAVIDGGSYLTQWREPEEVLAEATKAAVALKKVVSMKEKPVIFNGEQYLEREDWGTVAKFYGCTAKSVETRYVEFGSVRGFEAVAVVIDRNMNEIGRAESMCLSDEENWGDIPKYEWQDVLDENGKKIWDANLRNGKGGYKAQKVKVGTTSKPLFQLRSMAQTRAEAKALKGVFSWVVVLAGYRPTPAEEMTGNEQFEEREQKEKKPPVQQPQRASEKKAEPQTQPAQTQQATQAASKPTEVDKENSGVIEKVQQSKGGTLWLTLKGHSLLVGVPEKHIDVDMVAGNFIKFRGGIFNNKAIGDYWELKGLLELQKVQEGEVVTEPKEKPPLAADAAAVADEMFGGKPNAVAEMVENGTLKPASALPEGGGKKPGTIGVKRAQRIYTLASQNKKTNNGFCEEEIKKILTAIPVPLEHLRDLETGMYEQFEKWAVGEEDYREFWKD